MNYCKLPFCFILLIFFVLTYSLFGQPGEAGDLMRDSSPPVTSSSPEKAAPFLQNLKINNTEAKIIAQGYWRMKFSLGGRFTPEDGGTSFEGIDEGFNFLQKPDLNLSLLVADRWFVEATLLNNFDKNIYRVGYKGKEGEIVQEVSAGNGGINMNPYAFIKPARPQTGTPGFLARFETSKSKHELLVRYDASSITRKTFQGNYEIQTSTIPLYDYIRGQYFILPDRNISNSIIYIENSNGSITGTDTAGRTRRYKRLEPAEYFINLREGTLNTPEPLKKALLIYYESPKGPVGDDSSPQNQRGGRNFILPADNNLRPGLASWNGKDSSLLPFDWSETNEYDPLGRSYRETLAVDIEGRPALILFHPNIFTPFEALNHYPAPREIPEEKWRSDVLLRKKGESVPSDKNLLTFETSSTRNNISVYGTTGSTEINTRHPANRYPFARTTPNIYGPSPDKNPDTISIEMLLSIRSASRGFRLGSSIIPDSVQININGNPVSDFTTSKSGTIEFQRFVFPSDWVEISFRREGGSLSRGNLRIYQGNLFQFTPQFKWELAESFQWYFSPEKYSTDFANNTGELRLASLLEWKSDKAGASLALDTRFRNNDTIGILRLYGMDSDGLELTFFTGSPVRSPETISSPPLTSASRHNITRFNYNSYDGLGRSILNDFLWADAKNSGSFGPGLASGGKEKSGRVIDMRFNIPDSSWSAGDILLDKKKTLDLSSYSSLNLPLKFIREEGSTPPRLILQIGEIGEREDYQNNGFIDPSDTGSSISVQLDTAEWSTGNSLQAWESGEWRTVRIPINPRLRARLKRTRAMRLILQNPGGKTVKGRLIIGAPRLDGLSFLPEIHTPNARTIQSDNIANDEIIDNSIKTAFPATASVFHPKGGNNHVLRTRWGNKIGGADNLAPADYWQIKSWFKAVPIQAYGKLIFYIKDEEGAGPVTAAITNAKGKGLHLSWTPVKNSWDKITIDIPRNKAYSANGGKIHSLRIDQENIQLTNFTLKGVDKDGQTISSSRSGSLLLDEIHFSTPLTSFQGTGNLNLFWENPEDIYSWKNIPILGNIKIKANGSFAGETILSGLELREKPPPGDAPSRILSGNNTYRGSNFGTTLEASADTLGMHLQGHWRGSWTKNKSAQGTSHSIRIPARTKSFWLRDFYARNNQNDSFERENKLQVNLTGFSLNVLAAANLENRTLLQQWKGNTDWKTTNWKGRFSANYSRKTPDITESTREYLDSWIQGYTYLAPVYAQPTSREARHNLRNTLKWKYLSIIWNPQLNISQTTLPGLKQVNHWKNALEFPLEFESWQLNSFYSREWREERNLESEDYDGFDDAWRMFTDSASSQHPLIHHIPFAEIFGDGSSFRNTSMHSRLSTYKAATGVKWSRKTRGELLELILPGKLGVSMERRYKRDADTVGWENIWQADIGFNLRNMFGEFGYYSLTKIYNSEEIYSDFKLKLKDTNGNSFPGIKSLSWNLIGNFQGDLNSIFKLENKLTWDWGSRKTTQKSILSLDWRKPAKDSLNIPFIKNNLNVQNYIAHTESLRIDGVYIWTESPTDSSKEKFLFSLHHESGIIFPDWGHIKASVTLGMGQKNKKFSSVWETAIELELHF